MAVALAPRIKSMAEWDREAIADAKEKGDRFMAHVVGTKTTPDCRACKRRPSGFCDEGDRLEREYLRASSAAEPAYDRINGRRPR